MRAHKTIHTSFENNSFSLYKRMWVHFNMFNVCADVYWVTVPSYGYLAIASPSPWHRVISRSWTTPHPPVNLTSLQLCLHLLQTSCGSCSQKLQIYLLRSKKWIKWSRTMWQLRRRGISWISWTETVRTCWSIPSLYCVDGLWAYKGLIIYADDIRLFTCHIQNADGNGRILLNPIIMRTNEHRNPEDEKVQNRHFRIVPSNQ